MDRVQRYNQRLLRHAVRETRLITSIEVTGGRQIRVASVSWDEYWEQCGIWGREIARLKSAWTALIAGNFAVHLRRDLVRAYFLLLRTCLDGHACGQISIPVLRKIVGFETIRVSGDCGGSVAAVISARHPVYLLGKVARPDAPENPKYLPLICPCGVLAEPGALYWHYRRIPLTRTGGIQLFVYPPADVGNRPLSHLLIGQLFACNLFSRFSIERIAYSEANALVGLGNGCEPVNSQVLRPAELIETNTLGRIQHGIGRFVFKNGWVFRQFSSSDYFKAIHLVVSGALSDEDCVYVPFRVFDDATLVLPSGRSRIAQLLTMASHLVIEDADMLPCHLDRHFKQFSLGDLSVTDLTDRAKRRGAVIYLVERRPRQLGNRDYLRINMVPNSSASGVGRVPRP